MAGFHSLLRTLRLPLPLSHTCLHAQMLTRTSSFLSFASGGMDPGQSPYLLLEAVSASVFAEGIHESDRAVPLAVAKVQTDDVLGMSLHTCHLPWPLPSGRTAFMSPFLGPEGSEQAAKLVWANDGHVGTLLPADM